MNYLKKIWSLIAIFGMIIGLIPMPAFAETIADATVVINQAEITNLDDEVITEKNRLESGEAVKIRLDWALSQSTLLEDGAARSVNLPTNLVYSDQSGTLGELGTYEVSDNQLRFTFNQNYVLDEDEKTPDFSSVKIYEGTLVLDAVTNETNAEAEPVDFGDGIKQTLYYNKKVDPVADPLTETKKLQESATRAPRVHEPNLNDRGVKLFNNIKITDLNGNEFTSSNPAVKDANVKIHFDWSLADDIDIQNGDYFTYQLPDYFSVHNPVERVLIDAETNKSLGKFTVDENGLLTVTFNDEGSNLSVRAGMIELTTELKVITDTEQIEIETDITDKDENKITIIIPMAKADIQKSGIINEENTVIWTIVANQQRLNLANAMITDTLPEGLSVWYTNYYIQNADGNWVTAPTDFVKAHKPNSTTYEFTFPTGDLKVPVKIEIKMTIKDKEKTDFLNKVSINGKNFQSNSAEASVAYKDKDNYKKLINYDLDQGILNWEVKTTFTQDEGIFKDWMYGRTSSPETALHYLKEGTLKIYDESNNEISSDDWEFAITDSKDYEKKDGKYVHFTLKFKKKGVYTIKYSTEAFDKPIRPNTGFANFATVYDGKEKVDLSGGETVKADGELGVKKEAYNKNNTDSTVEYKITINSKKIIMKDAVITDRFESLSGAYKGALQLIESTLVISADNKDLLVKNVDYELEHLEGDSDYRKGFVVKLKGDYADTTETLVLKYKANFFIDQQSKNEYGSANLRFDNCVMVSYTGEDGKNHTDGAEVAFWADPKLAYNGVKYGIAVPKDGDLSEKIPHKNPFNEATAPVDSVYWAAVFNTWKVKLPKGTTISEALGEGQTLREIVIYDVELSATKVEVGSLVGKWKAEEDYVINEENGIPVIKLLREKTKPFAIFVSADASEDVYKYKNVATMTVPNESPLKVEGVVEKSDKSAWIDKDGEQGTGNDYRLINWSVVLNKDGHKVVQPSIKDTVNLNDQSFVYDDNKNVVVNVYKAESNGSGGFVKGEAVVFDEANKPYVTVDSVNGTQTLTITLGESINSPYIVEYQTLLDPGIQNNEKISNSATLFGKDVSIQNTTKEVVVKSTDGEGTSSGKNGSLKFEKLDEGNNLITSDSAFFDLYRKDNEGNLSLLFSDIEVKGNKIIENGSEIEQLSNLRYGTYVIIENKAPDGYEKDNTEHEFVISKDQVNYTFSLVNHPKTSNKGTSVKLEALKNLVGRTIKADEFSFKLTGADDNVEQTKKNDADGKVFFDGISYSSKGVYHYTIAEVIPSTEETGMTYDKTIYNVTVTVKDKDGKLEATVEYENVKAGEVPVFKNTYKALPTNISLAAEKDLSGRQLKADEFSFKLKGDGVDQTKKNDADGKVQFDKIEYTKTGTYEYTISEVIPVTEETGMTYDKTEYKVTVNVKEEAGKLVATAAYENVEIGKVPVFKNTYQVLPDSLKLKAEKDLSGRQLKADEFSFKLKGDGVDQTKKNDEDGKIQFDKIEYTKTGTYEYTISEVIPVTEETGMTYDKTEYKVTVNVKEEAGKLVATAAYENVEIGKVPVFKNTYQVLPDSLKLKAEKVLSGRQLKADEFSFTLKGDGVDQTKKNDADGKVQFDKIEYTKAGIYEYKISEVIPSEKEAGMTYDKTQYKVTVTVKEEANKLEASAVYEKLKAGEVPIFKNVYKADATSIQLEAQKKMTGRTLKDKEFSFNLTGEGIDQTVKNSADGKILFDAIEYEKTGTYEYTISEVIPKAKEANITYDDTEFKAIVKIEDIAGKLEASVTYSLNDPNSKVPTFKNVYTPEKKVETGEILLKKVDSKTGKTLADAEFKLVTADNKPVIGHEKIVTGKDGTIIIKGLTDGDYQLIETKAPKGYQIDETPIKFSVTNSQPSKKELSKENTRISLPETSGSSGSNGGSTTTYRQTNGTSTTSKRLPSTGSTQSWGVILLGMIFLASVGFVLFGKRRKV